MHLKTQWYPELTHYAPTTPVILVGTKLDLRDDKNTIRLLFERDLRPISPADGQKLKKDIGAVKYLECSALTQKGLCNVFEETVLTVLNRRELPVKSRKSRKCAIL